MTTKYRHKSPLRRIGPYARRPWFTPPLSEIGLMSREELAEVRDEAEMYDGRARRFLPRVVKREEIHRVRSLSGGASVRGSA